MKKIIVLFVIVALMATTFVGCKKEEGFMDIEGTKVSIDEAKFFVFSMESQIGSEAMSQQSPYSDKEETIGDYVKAQALETVKTISLAAYIAKEKKIALTDEETNEAKGNAKDYFETIGEDVIKENGITLESIESILIKYAYLDKLIEAATDDSEIDQEKVNQDLEMYAMQNRLYGFMVEKGVEEAAKSVKAKHILIKTIDDAGADLPEEEVAAAKAKAEEALTKAKAGEDFAALVQEYSQDTASLATDGEMTFKRGEMVSEFEDSAFSLKAGEISDLVKTEYGYHIIKVEETNIPGTEEEMQKLKELEENILKQAKRAQKEVAFQEKIETWLTEYKIQVDEKKWDAYEVTGQTKKGQADKDKTEDKSEGGTEEDTPEE